MREDTLSEGKTFVLERVLDEGLQLRLLDLGILPGMQLTWKGNTLLGNTIILETPVGSMAIRREEWKQMEVRVDG